MIELADMLYLSGKTLNSRQLYERTCLIIGFPKAQLVRTTDP